MISLLRRTGKAYGQRPSVAPIPRYAPYEGPALFSAGFRPFFLASAIWAALAIPLWLCLYASVISLPTDLPPVVWHVHEMVYGFAAATVAGFMLTAIPNWTGRMPLQGRPLVLLVALWSAGRLGVLLSGAIGAPAAAVLDLSFPAVFLAAMAREILRGRNWRNLPMLGALTSLLVGNLLVHGDSLGFADTADLGNRLGLATLLFLIALMGGRIIPSFTRNWLAKMRPGSALPSAGGRLDLAVLAITGLALAGWIIFPHSVVVAWVEVGAGAGLIVRLARWRGLAVLGDPLLAILHVGYAWLAGGFILLGLDRIHEGLPPGTAVHALTAGAIGTMTLAVMTRASLSHTGRPLVAGRGTVAIYLFITAAAILRVLAPLAGGYVDWVLSAGGLAWTAAFGLFAVLYGGLLARPRIRREKPPA
jgi:uncharacterized protein involved in response to NO